MITDSKKTLNKRILQNLQAEKEYCIACKNYERLESLEIAIRQHERMILDEYESND